MHGLARLSNSLWSPEEAWLFLSSSSIVVPTFVPNTSCCGQDITLGTC